MLFEKKYLRKRILLIGLFVLIVSFFQGRIYAVELITNGGFENVTNFSGWTVVNSPSPWRQFQNTTSGQGGGFISVATTTIVQGTKNAWNGMTDNITTNSQWQLYQNITIPTGQAVNISWRDRYQVNHTQFCPTGACQPKFYFVELVNPTTNAVLQTLHTQSTIGNVNQDTGWVFRLVTVSNGFAGQTVRLRFRGTETTPLSGPGQVEIDAVSANSFTPTASTATLGGKVTDIFGQGIRNIEVKIIRQNGMITATTTNNLGFFSVSELPTGEFYIVEVDSKRYSFNPNTLSHQLFDDYYDLEFVGNEL